MAELLGSSPGEEIGYRLRGESRVSGNTRIEVVTEGYACAMLQADPMMSDYDWIIIDEFHERHIDGDLLLATIRDLYNELGPVDSPGIILMTATWQGQPVEELNGFSFHSIEGSLYPVEHRFYPGNQKINLHDRIEWGVELALKETDGKILVFLPGRRELDEAYKQLSEWNGTLEISLLFGGMQLSEQHGVMLYSGPKRQVILATAVAETSLTIEGVTAVVDSGLERLPLYHPQTGLTRLITRRVSRATANQRSGRAGRLCPGTAYRLWSESEDRELIERWDPEILTGDLSRARLQAALWNNGELPWLTPPPEGKWKHAGELLMELDAVDNDGRITERGRQLAKLPLHPRLAHMVISAPYKSSAGLAAAVLSEGYRFKLKGSFDEQMRAAASRGDLAPLRKEAGLITSRIETAEEFNEREISLGGLLSLAYPDRIGRKKETGVYELVNGSNLLCRNGMFEWAVFPEINGSEDRLTAPYSEELLPAEIERLHPGLFRVENLINYEQESGKFRSESFRMMGKLRIKKLPPQSPAPAELLESLKSVLNRRGIEALPLNKASINLLNRLNTAAAAGFSDMPTVKTEELLKQAEDWLLPWLSTELSPSTVEKALRARMNWEQSRRLNSLLPETIQLRPGQIMKIDYSNPDKPKVSGRIQEFYGLSRVVTIAGGRIKLAFELLSPAMRPLQTTNDLAAFWTGSYSQIRGEMRGRYSKHFWPENPEKAPPSLATGKNRPEIS